MQLTCTLCNGKIDESDETGMILVVLLEKKQIKERWNENIIDSKKHYLYICPDCEDRLTPGWLRDLRIKGDK